MQLQFKERMDRLNQLTGLNILSDDFPFLKGIKISKSQFQDLERCLSMYIFACTNAAEMYTKESFLLPFFLPNVTPNGLMLPKKEVFLEFNLLHKCVVGILKSLKIDDFIDLVHLPLSVRIIDGVFDKSKESRRYATTKLHTDIWNGDSADALGIFFPVLGDVQGNSVEFFEPDEVEMKEWIKVLPDYQDGHSLLESSRKYDFCWDTSHVYFTDPFLLHRTIKSGSGMRVSVDFRIIPRRKVQSDKINVEEGGTNWRRNFISLKDWYKVGQSSILVPRESMAETIERIKTNNFPVVSDYGYNFRQIEIRGDE